LYLKSDIVLAKLESILSEEIKYRFPKT